MATLFLASNVIFSNINYYYVNLPLYLYLEFTMSTEIVSAIEEIMIPEVKRLGKLITGVTATVENFAQVQAQLTLELGREATFIEVCEAFKNDESLIETLDKLERLSSDLVSEVDPGIIDAIAQEIDPAAPDAAKVLSFYSHRLAIVTGSFRLRLYDPLITIAANEQDKDDFDALTHLAVEIEEHFVNPVKTLLAPMALFMKVLGADDGYDIDQGEFPSYTRWQTFALHVLYSNIGESVVKVFLRPIGEFGEKQIHLAKSGFDVEAFNRKIQDEDERFDSEAERTLTLEEFGIEPNTEEEPFKDLTVDRMPNMEVLGEITKDKVLEMCEDQYSYYEGLQRDTYSEKQNGSLGGEDER